MVSDLNKNLGGSTDLVKERYRSADLHTRIHFPLFSDVAGPKGEVQYVLDGGALLQSGTLASMIPNIQGDL